MVRAMGMCRADRVQEMPSKPFLSSCYYRPEIHVWSCVYNLTVSPSWNLQSTVRQTDQFVRRAGKVQALLSIQSSLAPGSLWSTLRTAPPSMHALKPSSVFLGLWFCICILEVGIDHLLDPVYSLVSPFIFRTKPGKMETERGQAKVRAEMKCYYYYYY